MRLPLQVLVYVARVIEGEREYLMLHRTPSRGAFWQGVTGGAEAGEEPIDTARRELTEETRLVPMELSEVGYAYSFPLQDSWRHLYAEDVKEITEKVLVAVVDGRQSPVIDPGEHDNWQWSNVDTALKLLVWPENIEALKRCDLFLANK